MTEYSEGYRDGYRKGFDDGIQAGSGQGVPLYKGAPRRRMNPKYERAGPTAPRRRKTAYQTAYSVAYKRLKKKHPRMAFGSLSKKAHAAARKKVK